MSKKTPSPEALKAKARREQKSIMKKQMKIIKSIKETQTHDRKTCTCEGCHNYALVSTIMQNGRLYTIVRDWDEISPEEYQRSLQQLLQYKADKKMSPEVLMGKLRKRGIPDNQAEYLVNQMLAPVHVVFYKPSPLGLMKEI